MNQGTGIWDYAKEHPILFFLIVVITLSILGDVATAIFARSETKQPVILTTETK